MMSKIKFENLKQLEKELQARLDLEHAEKVVEHAKTLWGSQVELYTDIEDELWEI